VLHRAAHPVQPLILAYWRFAKGYYVKDGKPTKELACMRYALRPLRKLYGTTRAAEFGPTALKTVRQHMIDEGLSRGFINHRISRLKRVFKWAASEELAPPTLYHGLQTVAGLRLGRTNARETEPVTPVAAQHVEAVLPFTSPQVAAMIQIQELTAMRPGELVIMRPSDIDRSDDIWIYSPQEHKARWRGQQKLILLGPKAQRVLDPFLSRAPTEYLFSPAEAHEWWQLQRRKNRRTPMTPSHARQRRKAKPKRAKRARYDTHSYGNAVEYAIKKARKAGLEIPHWHVNQLRHSRGTEVRKQYGVEGAQAVLGHVRADVTQVYAQKSLELAMKIAKETG